jgi:hypothetical protein
MKTRRTLIISRRLLMKSRRTLINSRRLLMKSRRTLINSSPRLINAAHTLVISVRKFIVVCRQLPGVRNPWMDVKEKTMVRGRQPVGASGPITQPFCVLIRLQRPPPRWHAQRLAPAPWGI